MPFKSKHLISGVLFIFILAILSSCQKDELAGEREILEGRWEWAYTQQWYDDIGSPNDPPTDTIFASSCFDTYELDFLEKGIVKSSINGKVKKRKRIVFQRFTELNSGTLSIIIELNNNQNKTLGINLRESNDEDLFITQNSDFTKLPYEDNPAGSFPGDNTDTNYVHYYRRVD